MLKTYIPLITKIYGIRSPPMEGSKQSINFVKIRAVEGTPDPELWNIMIFYHSGATQRKLTSNLEHYLERMDLVEA